MYEVYGQTENCRGCHLNAPGKNQARHGWSVGPMGREVNISPQGEILIRGDFSCSWAISISPKRTAETIDKDGWLHTGDVGTLDDDGFCASRTA